MVDDKELMEKAMSQISTEVLALHGKIAPFLDIVQAYLDVKTTKYVIFDNKTADGEDIRTILIGDDKNSIQISEPIPAWECGTEFFVKTQLGYTNWKDITKLMEYKSDIELVDPYHTSKDCSRCGCVNKDLKGEKFVCINENCGLVINRQSNAAINVYLKMEGLSQNIENRIKWFDENVLSEFTDRGGVCYRRTGGHCEEGDQ